MEAMDLIDLAIEQWVREQEVSTEDLEESAAWTEIGSTCAIA
jgi:hypothetical protein